MIINRLLICRAVLCALVLVAAAVACDSSEDGDTTVSASCGAFDGFDSYRYSISVKMQLPDLQNAPQSTPAPALGVFADSLAALLSDFTIDGAYVAPDRRQAILDFQGEEVELREVGDQRWERFGDSWEELASGSPEIDDLSPKLVCTDLVEALAPSLVRMGEENADVNGVRAERYSIDKTNIEQLRDLLGVSPETDLPEEFQVDVWFASDGDWPVRLDIRSQTTDAQGGLGTVEFLMELRDVNDSGITIDAPLGASEG